MRFLAAFGVAFVMACGTATTTQDASTEDGATCTDGQTQACTGPNACGGKRTCSNGVFQACVCPDSGTSDASDDNGMCQPDMTPFTPKWIPPNMLSVCTPSQVDAAWTACGPGGQQCGTFVNANMACAACLFTPFGTSSSYGAVMTWNNGGSMQANVPGCIAAIDGDFSSTGCAAKVQAQVSCMINACLVCPGQYLACAPIASASVCKSFAAAAQCINDAKYSSCKGTLETDFKSFGRMFCAGATDAGTD